MLELIDGKKAVAANDFTATDSANRSIKLSDYRDKKNVCGHAFLPAGPGKESARDQRWTCHNLR